MLEELTRQLDNGSIYDRDIRSLARALSDVLTAFERWTTATVAYRRS